MVAITTRDVVIGEEQFKCKREPENESDRYTVAVKKVEIIIGHLLQKIFQVCRITFTILTLRNRLTSLSFVLSQFFLYFMICQSYNA